MEIVTFRRWLRQQETRDDRVGDLARDMARDPGQNMPNPSLNGLYHHIRMCVGACSEALETLIDAYREWQGLGYTYRATRDRPRQSITPRLRFKVFKRDSYCCQICGRTAQDGVVLELDHKVAVRRGGTDDLDNLWTLCFECNRGKRDESL